MDDVVRAFLENEQRLRLVRRIGRGGFGEVWEAESESGIRSAVKVSLDSIDDQNPAVKKELENLKLVKALTGHPHIVGLLDYWLVSSFLVTRWELATDGTLQDMLERYRQDGQPGIPLKQLIKWIYEAANGLDFLHEKGIYHRDIKPQNLLLFHGHVKLGDLGLAKLVGASTASHTGSGTFGYLPPEAWGEHRLTPSVDLYSLVATYIKLRTGQEPFGTNPVEIVERQKRGAPILEGLEDWEKSFLLAALHPDPAKRFSGMCRSWVEQLVLARRRVSSPTTKDRPSDRPKPPELEKRPDIVVGRDGITTLEEAIERCPGGKVIGLPAGVYRLKRPLEITKPVELLGEGMDATRVVCDGEGYVIKVTAPRFTARRISFEHLGANWADVVVIDSPSVLIEACRFRGGVWDEQNERGGTGLWIYGAAMGVIKNCRSTQNGLNGITLSGLVELLLEGNTCEGNKLCGILYTGNAGGRARKNVCRNNALGIGLSDQAAPTLEGNTCEGNKQDGILYAENAGGTACNNVCRNNGSYGIGVQGQAAPTLEGNTCEGNKQCGIFFWEKASGAALNNVCRNNGHYGIKVQGQAAPTLEGNVCEENGAAEIARSSDSFEEFEVTLKPEENGEDEIGLLLDDSELVFEGEVTREAANQSTAQSTGCLVVFLSLLLPFGYLLAKILS